MLNNSVNKLICTCNILDRKQNTFSLFTQTIRVYFHRNLQVFMSLFEVVLTYTYKPGIIHTCLSIWCLCKYIRMYVYMLSRLECMWKIGIHEEEKQWRLMQF